MPRFFFHIHDGVDLADATGTDLSNLEAARAHAMQLAAKYIGSPTAASDGGALLVDVHDDIGNRIFVARLVAAFENA